MKQYIDYSVYPDVPRDQLPKELVSELDRSDYVDRICGAWDFDIWPAKETLELLSQWKDVFDKYPLPLSPAYHTCRHLFGWEPVPTPGNPHVHLTHEAQDRLEGRAPDLSFV